MSELRLTWGKCGNDGHWCDFLRLDLETDYFKDLKGVYVIWNDEDKVVRVGSPFPQWEKFFMGQIF